MRSLLTTKSSFQSERRCLGWPVALALRDVTAIVSVGMRGYCRWAVELGTRVRGCLSFLRSVERQSKGSSDDVPS